MGILKTIKYLVIGIYVMCGILLAVFIIPQTGWKALVVLTDSMSPAIPRGSLIIVRQVMPQELNTGDVITFTNPADQDQTVTHRIIKKQFVGNAPAFITKGDANKEADPLITGGEVVGRVETHIAGAGTIIKSLASPLGIGLFIILPGVLIIIDEFRRMTHKLQKIAVEEARQAAPPPADPPGTPPSAKAHDTAPRRRIQ